MTTKIKCKLHSIRWRKSFQGTYKQHINHNTHKAPPVFFVIWTVPQGGRLGGFNSKQHQSAYLSGLCRV